jgi:peroxin-2
MTSHDALQIDHELSTLFRAHIERSVNLILPDGIETFKPEIDALLATILWWTCIWKQRPTPGMSMLNLHYDRSRGLSTSSQRIRLGFCMTFAPWLLERTRRLALSNGWPSRPPDSREGVLWRSLERIESMLRYVHLIHFVAYLSGMRQFPSIGDMVSGMRVKSTTGDFRQINFQFMNRQLLWESFTRFVRARNSAHLSLFTQLFF